MTPFTSFSPDTYAVYSAWYRDHYGEPYPVTRERWNEMIRAPRRPEPVRDFDIETEQREGWAYGNPL